MLGHKLFVYDEESVLRVIKYFEYQISVSSALSEFELFE
jgi:hypothetical protein